MKEGRTATYLLHIQIRKCEATELCSEDQRNVKAVMFAYQSSRFFSNMVTIFTAVSVSLLHYSRLTFQLFRMTCAVVALLWTNCNAVRLQNLQLKRLALCILRLKFESKISVLCDN
jgi:hypothetical protein